MFSGRTECQTAALGNLTNSTNNFERKSSQRFSRRASCAIRKKIQEQEIRREQEDERLKKLKSEQEAKLVSNQDLTNVARRLSTAQKILPATQRLDNLILGTTNDLPLTGEHRMEDYLRLNTKCSSDRFGYDCDERSITTAGSSSANDTHFIRDQTIRFK